MIKLKNWIDCKIKNKHRYEYCERKCIICGKVDDNG